MKNLKSTVLSLLIIALISTVSFGMPMSDHIQQTQRQTQIEGAELAVNPISGAETVKDRRVLIKQKRSLKNKVKGAVLTNENDSGRIAAIIGYIGIFGLLISWFALHEKGNAFSAFHLRQSLGLSILSLVPYGLSFFTVFLPILSIVLSVLGILIFVALILSLISAIKGEEKETFLFGKSFQKWFADTIT